MKRHSPEWLNHVADTGRWWEPPPWQEPGYLDTSPWSLSELEVAFQALQKVYPSEVAKQIFQRWDGVLFNVPLDVARQVFQGQEVVLFDLLNDFQQPSYSKLLALGFYAKEVEPWAYSELLGKLQHPDQFHGACFEVKIWAVFQRAGINVIYEPFRGGSPNPDFLLPDLGLQDGLIIDAKLPRVSASNQDKEDLLQDIVMRVFGDRQVPPARKIEFTPACDDKLRTNKEYRTRLWKRRHQLSDKVREALIRLAASESFPAHEIIKMDNEELVRVEVPNPPTQNEYCGATFNWDEEAKRIIDKWMVEGAKQIPPDRIGAVLVGAYNHHTTIAHVACEAERWFEQESQNYQRVVGAIVVGRFPFEKFESVIPVWRPTAPRELRETDVWDRFTTGLNWWAMRVHQWQSTLESKQPAAPQ